MFDFKEASKTITATVVLIFELIIGGAFCVRMAIDMWHFVLSR